MTKINFLALKRNYGKTLNTATSKIELFVIKHNDFKYLAIVLKSSILHGKVIGSPFDYLLPMFSVFLIKFPVSQVIDCFILILFWYLSVQFGVIYISYRPQYSKDRFLLC